jgi:hypothetical protein
MTPGRTPGRRRAVLLATTGQHHWPSPGTNYWPLTREEALSSLSDEDREWLERMLEEYRELFEYLRDREVSVPSMKRSRPRPLR